MLMICFCETIKSFNIVYHKSQEIIFSKIDLSMFHAMESSLCIDFEQTCIFLYIHMVFRNKSYYKSSGRWKINTVDTVKTIRNGCKIGQQSIFRSAWSYDKQPFQVLMYSRIGNQGSCCHYGRRRDIWTLNRPASDKWIHISTHVDITCYCMASREYDRE